MNPRLGVGVGLEKMDGVGVDLEKMDGVGVGLEKLDGVGVSLENIRPQLEVERVGAGEV